MESSCGKRGLAQDRNGLKTLPDFPNGCLQALQTHASGEGARRCECSTNDLSNGHRAICLHDSSGLVYPKIDLVNFLLLQVAQFFPDLVIRTEGAV